MALDRRERPIDLQAVLEQRQDRVVVAPDMGNGLVDRQMQHPLALQHARECRMDEKGGLAESRWRDDQPELAGLQPARRGDGISFVRFVQGCPSSGGGHDEPRSRITKPGPGVRAN